MSIYRDAALYDEQYLSYRDDIPHYQRLAHDLGGPVLELGAGTGRLTVALAKAGVEVVGVESSPQMLERARARIETEQVGQRVKLVEADMRQLKLDHSFPLVIAAFNTLMHAYTLADQDATLAAVMGHLTPDGVFAFDLFIPDFGPLGVLRREAEWAGVGGENSELFLVQEHDPATQVVVSRYYLDTVASDGTLTRRSASLRQRYYTRFEIERALRQAGFSRLRVYGDFDRRPFGNGARKLVVIAYR